MLLESLDDIWKRYNSSKYHANFHWNQAKSENTDFFLSQLKSPETPKMGLISISNDKNANLTKFERNPLENKRYEIFISGTPNSRRTFGNITLTPPRVPKSTCLFYNHKFFVSNLSFSVKKFKKSQIEKKLWLQEVGVKKILEFKIVKNLKKTLFHAIFNEIGLTNHVFKISQSLFWFSIYTWLCFLHFHKNSRKMGI